MYIPAVEQSKQVHNVYLLYVGFCKESSNWLKALVSTTACALLDENLEIIGEHH